MNAVSAREEYSRRLAQRQTVIFGSIVGVLAVLFLAALLFWSGLIPFPYQREFSKAPDPNALIIPCLSESGSEDPVDLSTVQADVYNSTTQAGLAATVGENLSTLGVQVGYVGNWGSSVPFKEAARIQTGKEGIAAAYSLQPYIKDSVVQYKADMVGAKIAVVVGESFSGLLSVDDVAQKTGGKIKNADNCVPATLKKK